MEPGSQALVARVRAGGPIAGWAEHGMRRWVRAGLGIVGSPVCFVIAWFYVESERVLR